MSTLTEDVNVGDVIKYETPNGYCRELLALKTNTAQHVLIGSPLRSNTGYILVANGQEANATAISLEDVDAPSDATVRYVVALVRGPAIVDSNRIQCETDVAWSELAAYFLALGIIGRAEPTTLEDGIATS
jgi:hypothetical protein